MASGSWIRPLSGHENLCRSMSEADCMKISYVLRLRTSKLVSEQDAREVFTALLRTTASLRMQVQERDGVYWFREMSEKRIDFGVIPNADVLKENHRLVHHRFKADFPLWCVRMLPWNSDQVNFVNSTKLNRSEEGNIPFLCHVLLCFHHSITDGFSCHEIIKSMLNMFEDVLSGQHVNIDEQNSVFLDLKAEENAFREIELEFESKQRSLEKRNKSYHNVVAECILPEAYKIPINNPAETVCFNANLDETTTQLFKQRCKKQGVTFNSGFTAILDAAYVKLLSDQNVKRDFYRVTVLHCMNKRAYFKDYKPFGNFMGLIDTAVNTPNDVIKNFWPYAMKIHNMIKDQQTLKNPFEQDVIEKLTGDSPLKPFVPEEVKEDSLPPMVTYSTTNMMDVTKTFTDTERMNVQLEWYDRLSTLHLLPLLWCSVFQTFRGQLMHSLQYNSHFIEHNTVQKLSDNIFQIISEVIEYP